MTSAYDRLSETMFDISDRFLAPANLNFSMEYFDEPLNLFTKLVGMKISPEIFQQGLQQAINCSTTWEKLIFNF
jgi:hypothetical protein